MEVDIIKYFIQDVSEECKNNIHFIKLHAPWPLLCKYAEELNLRAPLQVLEEVLQKHIHEIHIDYRHIQIPLEIGLSGCSLNFTSPTQCPKKFPMPLLTITLVLSRWQNLTGREEKCNL